MEVQKINFARLRNAEFMSVIDNVVRIVKPYDWEAANVQKFYTDLTSGRDEFNNHLNKFSTLEETKEVVEADMKVNDGWRAIKWVCKAKMLSPEESERKAAALIYQLVKIHGSNLHNNSYPEQNAKANMFLTDCETKVDIIQAANIMGLNSYLTHLKTAIENLVKTIEVRNLKAIDEQRDFDTKTLRTKVYDRLMNIFKYMESMSTINPGGDLDQMIKRINENITKVDMAVKKRYNPKDDKGDEEA
jgi:hypothetical protein